MAGKYIYIKLLRDAGEVGPRVTISNQPGWLLGVEEEALPTQSTDNPAHEWGYGGAGPTQLAADILQYVLEWFGYQDTLVNSPNGRIFELAHALKHAFKEQWLVGMPYAGGTISVHAVRHWINGMWTDSPTVHSAMEQFQAEFAALSPATPVGDGYVIINPGSGPVNGSTEANALANMAQFLNDCPIDRHKLNLVRKPEADYGEGRFAFMVRHTDFANPVEIQMPGWELDKVRYTGGDGQNPFHFPRLYVNGSSYLWNFALLVLEIFEEANDE